MAIDNQIYFSDLKDRLDYLNKGLFGMKKILVVCDEYAFSYNGRFYLRSFGHELLSRYLDVFNEVRFLVRTKVVDNKNELGIYNKVVSNPNIEIFPIIFFQGPKEYIKSYASIKKQMNSCFDQCDGAVLRIPSTIAFACSKVLRKNKVPYIVEVVANPIEILRTSNKFYVKLLIGLMHFQQMKTCKEAYGASYVTQMALQKVYPIDRENSFETYYSSVNLPNSFFTGSRVYPYDISPFIICHVSHPIKTLNKGHLTFIKVICELNRRGYNVVGKIAGDGDLVAFFKQEANKLGISKKIDFLGLLNRDELGELLNSSHLMLFPTLSEGLPRVIIEAMATGLPCLSCPVGGIPEIINGDLLYATHDIDGFTSKIIEMINDVDKYEQNSKTVFERSKEFAADILKNRRIAFYSKFKTRIRT